MTSFGYGGDHSFNLLEVAKIVTGGLGDEILHRQAAALCVDTGTLPVLRSKTSKHPQVGFAEQAELSERFAAVARIVIAQPMPQALVISGKCGALLLGNLAVSLARLRLPPGAQRSRRATIFRQRATD
jgi:hypothetical protein